MRENIARAEKSLGADDVVLRLTSTLGNAICLDKASTVDDIAEAGKIFADNLRKATRIYGKRHPTTTTLVTQLKGSEKLMAAMRLQDRARVNKALGKQTRRGPLGSGEPGCIGSLDWAINAYGNRLSLETIKQLFDSGFFETDTFKEVAKTF